MIDAPRPRNQRSNVRPIAFALDDAGFISTPITLSIQPEDLTRNEPSRSSVHQTLGREVAGWVDNFGEGLPSVTIAGHTGWRYAQGSGMDGAQAFEALNDLVVRQFHAQKQSAIDRGIDPGLVKLLFIDTLDGFAWSVVPTQFVLRRSRSRPLLFQYNISLQAVDTTVDAPAIELPFFGTPSAGASSLSSAVARISAVEGNVENWVSKALGFVDSALSPIAGAIKGFVGTANKVFSAVNTLVKDARNLAKGIGNRLISMASDLASVGRNIFHTLNNIRNLPAALRADLGRVASAFNEVLCIFKNSLRPRKFYEEYTGVYGASGCSSTTGGRQDSPYANLNAFQEMQPVRDIVTIDSRGLSSVTALKRMDPVLAPVPFQEIGRYATNITAGVSV